MSYPAKSYYQNRRTAGQYDAKRFRSIPGRLNHFLEETFVRGAVQRLMIESALDVACGTGRLTRVIQDCGVRTVMGIDISREMLTAAREHRGYEGPPAFQRADASRLPFAANAYDLVMSFRFLDHLPADDKMQVISEIIRVSNKYIIFAMASLTTSTIIARWVRKSLSRTYYEGFLIDEKSLLSRLKTQNVRLLKRTLKAPFLGMEIMYLCEKH